MSTAAQGARVAQPATAAGTAAAATSPALGAALRLTREFAASGTAVVSRGEAASKSKAIEATVRRGLTPPPLKP